MYSVLTQAVHRINSLKNSHLQVNIIIFNADVTLMMKMWDIATSKQGGLGLASFVGAKKLLIYISK